MANQPFAPAGPFRSVVYRLLWAWISGIRKLVNASAYAAAGLLHRDDLRSALMQHRKDYRVLADDVDAGLESWEEHLYFGLLRPGDRVLMIGSGGCRDLIPLCKKGFDVTGVEPVPELNEIARMHLVRHDVSATLITSAAENVALDGAFDVVIFCNLSYGYLLGAGTRIAMMSRLAAFIAPEGRIALSYVPLEAPSRFLVWLARTTSYLSRSDWRPEPGDCFYPGALSRRIVGYDSRFTPDQIADELAAAGLRVTRDEAIGDCRSLVAVAMTASQTAPIERSRRG